MEKIKKISWKHRPGMSEWEGKITVDGEKVVRFAIHGSYCVTDLGNKYIDSEPGENVIKSYKITDSDNGKEIAHDLLNGLNLEIHEANYQAMEDRSRESANTIAKAQDFLDKLHRKEEKQNEIDEKANTPESRIKQLEIKHLNEQTSITGYALNHSLAYSLIQQYYGDKRTERYGVPLIYHINEGGYILNYIGASDIVKDAYYLHPLLQSDEDFNKNLSMNFGSISTESIILAMEYRRVANSYLSTMSKSNFVGFPNQDIKDMLLADKVQNYKDFMKYHKDTHKRSVELEQYFLNWFELLDVSLHAVNNFIEQLENK